MIKIFSSLKKYTEALIHVIIWVILYLFAVLFFRTIGPFSRVDDTLLLPLTVGTLINVILFYSITLYLIPRYANKSRIKQFIMGLLGTFAGLTILETVLDFYFLVWVFSDSPEPFFGMMFINGIVHLFFASLGLGYGFTRSWLVNEKKKQELIREKLTAELNFLRTQLNPHFLFNVLNMAYSSASKKGDDQTADIIEKLSVLLRYMIYDSNAEKVYVERETGFIRNYINLQRMRLSSDLPVQISFSVNGNYAGYRIAPLILIPFIENAFKYGVKLEQKSEIFLSLLFHDHQLEFMARNTVFPGLKGREGASGVGIENARKRLAILYPGKHKLEINNDGKQFVVKLLLTLN